MVAYPVLIYLPSHFVFRRLFRPASVAVPAERDALPSSATA